MLARILALAVTLSVLILPPAATTACNEPIVPTNAIQGAQEAAQTAAAVVADAEVVWPIVYAAIPAASQAAAQSAYNEGIFTANHAEPELHDGHRSAVGRRGVDRPDRPELHVVGRAGGSRPHQDCGRSGRSRRHEFGVDQVEGVDA